VAIYVARYKAQGFDHLKLYDEHGETLDSLVTAAGRLGVPIMGHVPFGVTLEKALAARVRSIEHLEATRQAGVWNCPTLSVMVKSIQYKALWGPLYRRLVKVLHEAGAGLLLGSDDDGKKPGSVHTELRELVRAGLTPYQALETGTKNVALFYGTLDETGTVAAGKRADLVLLQANPLADIRHTTRLAGVMIGGRWLPREELDRRFPAANPEKRTLEEYFAEERRRDHRVQGELAAYLIGDAPPLSGLALTPAQLGPINDLKEKQGKQRRALSDSLPTNESDQANHQRVLGLIAQQTGEYRALLTPEQQAIFDPAARAWLREQKAKGYALIIPGVSQ
jgi:hypothetical protein